jgi:hypothetical protein
MHRCSKYYGDLVVRGQISQTCFPELLKLTLYFAANFSKDCDQRKAFGCSEHSEILRSDYKLADQKSAHTN